ncbi:MAG: hypothetical protein IJ087_05560 [Eggerthellaceae bacterium]|nr:hypothetical protein [Eggerthellaceae bacterium]
MRKKVQRVAAAFMALMLAFALTPSAAYATTNLTVGQADSSTETATLNKIAKTVKVGSYKITFKKGKGYLKFKAPKSKLYSFTFSNVMAKNGASAFVQVQTPYSSDTHYSFSTEVSTKGGKSTTLWLGVNGKTGYGTGVNEALKSRTAKMNLTKNGVVFFYFYNMDYKTTTTLKIK